MNPDVFITIAFGGLVVVVALIGLLVVVPSVRRADARTNGEAARRRQTELAHGSTPRSRSGDARAGRNAAVH